MFFLLPKKDHQGSLDPLQHLISQLQRETMGKTEKKNDSTVIHLFFWLAQLFIANSLSSSSIAHKKWKTLCLLYKRERKKVTTLGAPAFYSKKKSSVRTFCHVPPPPLSTLILSTLDKEKKRVKLCGARALSNWNRPAHKTSQIRGRPRRCNQLVGGISPPK